MRGGADAASPVIYGLAAAPAGERRPALAFAARSDGLLRSDAGAAGWRPALDALALTAPLPATGVALSGDTVFVGVPGGVLVSRDAGSTWEPAPFPDPPPFITALACSPAFAGDGTAFAATAEDGVALTYDGGRHWRAWNIGLFDAAVLCLAVSPQFAQDRLVLAGGESGLFVSANGGRRWEECALPHADAAVLCLACAPGAGAAPLLIVGTADHGLALSHDRGGRWTTPATPPGAVNAVLAAAAPGGACRLLALFDDVPYVSADAGSTWQRSGVLDDVVALAAPAGLAADAPLLLGLADGRIVHTTVLPAGHR